MPRPASKKFRLRAITWLLVTTTGALIVVYGLPVLAEADGWFQTFLISLLLVLALVLGLFEIRRLNSRLAGLARVANLLGKGKYTTRAEVRGEDAVSLVGQALNLMAERVALTVSQLEKSHEELGLSQAKLASQNQQLSQAYDRQSRFGDFLAKLNTIDLDALARESFPDLVAVARAHIGVLYLFDENLQQLQRLTEHGIDRGALRRLCPENSFEGLPGEAFSRREWITIDDLDQDLLPELDLGFASAHLQSVYAIPLLFNNKALGVVVLASLHKPCESTQQTLQNYVRALAHAMNNALTHQAVQQQTVQFELANTKLVNLDHHRRQFVANMSHELRTPLNSIIGFSNILLKNRDGSISTDNLDRLEKINRNGKHLLQLINDILDLSKVEAGRMETEVTETEIGSILREVSDMLQPQADAKNIRIDLDLPDEPVVIETDSQKVRQIVINLTNNAVKFTEKGSVTMRLHAPGTKYTGACIEVQDTGIGISEDKLESVFEAFQQADSTTSRKYGGTGLGLTISRTLLTLLGGRIRVSSKLGRGSTFSIELPHGGRPSRQAETDDLLFDELAPAR
jgi:signal transduction histidine kinase